MSELRVAALISDMDGVLVDTGGVYDRHWELWAERTASRRSASSPCTSADRRPRPSASWPRSLTPVAEARRFNEALADDPSAAGVLAMPGALALANAIPAERWAIATSAPRVMAERWLAHVGLALPSVMVTVEDVERGKPAPDPYLRAAELLGVAAADCLVIEDAPAGITAARAAGATVLGVLSTHTAAQLGDADHLVAALDAVEIRPDGMAGDLLVRWRPAPR